MHVCKSLLDCIKTRISCTLTKQLGPTQLRGLALSCLVALGLTGAMAPTLRAQAVEDRPRGPTHRWAAEPSGRPAGSRFALGLKASTLGLGADAGLRLARRFNVRVGFNAFNYSRNLSSDGIAYNSSFRLRSVQALLDWFPFRPSFHVSAGVLAYNGNHMTANALVSNGQTLSAGDETVISNPANPITGRATSAVRVVAPVIAIGFGNFVASTSHVGFSVDLGVVFQGAPHSTLTLRGSACDPSGEFCADIAGDPNMQAEALAEKRTIDKELFFMKYYPFVSLSVGYRF